jgi:predicted SAM-dependent methyltransferase
MDRVLFEQISAETDRNERKEFPSDQDLRVEQLNRAAGENALLQTEFSRQIALRIVGMLEAICSPNEKVECLRKQVEGLMQSVTHALDLARGERRPAQPSGVVPEGAARSRVVPRLLSSAKLLQMGCEVRLNIGCGTKPQPGYLNVDERELEGVELVADVRSLPFQPGTLAEIYASHLLEHFTEADLRSAVLPAWHRLLKPGGILRIAVPDAEGMIQVFSRGEYSFESLRNVTYGGQDYPGNFHYTMFSRESLRAILREAGFTVDQYTVLARPNGLCLEMEITATTKL